MSCMICGRVPTIKSHLIPKTLAREVQVGKAHAYARNSDDFDHTQSGIYERNILCKDCDNELGKWENIAAKAFRQIREESKDDPLGEHKLKDVSGDEILRFIAGLLWKYSVASKDNGRIDLGPYQDLMKGLAFSLQQVPNSIDALVCRLRRHEGDDDVFAYRAPKPDRQEGVNGYRVLVGGMFIFVKTDKQTPRGGALERSAMRGKSDLPYVLLRAQDFEEYRLSAELAHEGRLSDFLDKQDGQ